MVIQHGNWSKLQRLKSPISGFVMSWPNIKKIVFEVLSSCILCNSNKPFLCSIRLSRVTSGFYVTTCYDQLHSWTEKFQSTSKAKLAPKKSWSLFGGLLPGWSSIAFWIPVKPLQMRSMLGRLMRCTKNCNTCSRHWSTERARFFCPTTPNHTLCTQRFKGWMNWAVKLYLISHIQVISCQLITTSSSISTSFCREKTLTTNRRQKMLPKNSLNPEAQIFIL